MYVSRTLCKENIHMSGYNLTFNIIIKYSKVLETRRFPVENDESS